MKDMDLLLPEWMNVSRETFERLEAFVALVLQWNKTINLISKESTADVWQRHVLDSAQLMLHLPPEAEAYADLGAGGGFPGVIVAIMAAEVRPTLRATLVESDLRKAVFLSETSRKLGLAVTVVRDRVETLAPLGADLVSARALAPLAELCGYGQRHLAPGGTALFLKGNRYEAEIAIARQKWAFDLTVYPSKTGTDAALLALKGVSHV